MPLVIIGGGAAGMVAALAARNGGVDALVLERDALPQGSTALSAGLVPAAGTRVQRAAGIADSEGQFAADILRKAGHEPGAESVRAVTRAAAQALDWLGEAHGLAFSVIDDFLYPGHSAHRMHALASRSGQELIDRLRQAAEAAGADILCNAHVTALFAEPGGTVRGLELTRPDGAAERIGCRALILACGGYGGNKALVAKHIPELAGALYFGHSGNQGDAVLWGAALGAELRHLPGHQGHGSVAHPHGILISYAAITEGGFQVNTGGLRFSDESRGYSEQGAAVLAQLGGIAFSVFDARIASVARQFEDFRRAEAAGAVLTAATINALAAKMRVPSEALAQTFAGVEQLKALGQADAFGRDFSGVKLLTPPFYAVRVTGALFHTQGGLAVNGQARVLRPDGTALPNLYAAGGAAAGVSGSKASGYLSGNGLLTAVAYGYLAGSAAGV